MEEKLLYKKYNLVDLCDRFLIFSLTLMIFTIPLSESIKNIAFGMTLFFWLAQVLIKREFRIKIYALGWFHFAFLMVSILSALFAINVYQGFRGVWDIFRYFAVFLIIINNIDSERKIKLLIVMFVISISIGSIFGLYHSFVHGTLGWLKILSLGQQNHTATYLAMMISLMMALLINGNLKIILNILIGIFLSLSLIALIFTFSRANWVALFIISITFFLIKLDWKGIALFSLLISIFLLGTTFYHPLRGELKTFNHLSKTVIVLHRIPLWQGVIRFLKHKPLLGAGPRNFNNIEKEKYFRDKKGLLVESNHGHSLYFNNAAETGILGTFALLSWLSCYFVTWLKMRGRCYSDLSNILWLSTLGVFLTLTVSGIVTTTLHTEGAIAFTSIMGLMIASINIKSKVPNI